MLDYDLPASNLTGLAVDFSTDTLYSVNPTDLYKLVDTGSSSTWSSLVHLTDTAHYAFRGLSFAPTGAVPSYYPGDANKDGKVDINDLTIVLTNYGKAGQAWTQGVMDGDSTGTVDINDLTIVLTNYGKTYGAAMGIRAVPEPGTLALITPVWPACWLSPGVGGHACQRDPA